MVVWFVGFYCEVSVCTVVRSVWLVVLWAFIVKFEVCTVVRSVWLCCGLLL